MRGSIGFARGGPTFFLNDGVGAADPNTVTSGPSSVRQ